MKVAFLALAFLTACGGPGATPAPVPATTTPLAMNSTALPAGSTSLQVIVDGNLFGTYPVTFPTTLITGVPIVSGTHTITINDYNSAGVLIATGSTTYTIAPGTANTITVTLTPV